MAHVVTQPCCNDAACVAVCPVNCIHPTPDERAYARSEMLYIDPATCIDCGACVDECPVDAIVPPEDVTPEMQPFVEINAAYYKDNADSTPVPETAPSVAFDDAGVLRVAVVGSGPSACYLVDALSSYRGLRVEISVVEKLPIPGGLVRFGVAPDHAATKNMTSVFARSMGTKNVEVYLNVEVGRHVTHDDLLRHHHAVVYASGAKGDRSMRVPGDGLPGSVSAREFVAWYNGHPEYADLQFDLSHERAVVVGNGNVALDVARILTSDVSRLMCTDIAPHALEALASSRVREVVVLGRRGSTGAAYSTSELLGLGNIPGVTVTASGIDLDSAECSALERIRADIVARYGSDDAPRGRRRIHLQFLRSPVEVLGAERVEGVRVAVNEFGDRGVRPTGEYEDIEAGLVLRSIGFRCTPVLGVPFDEDRDILSHEAGAVIDHRSGARVAGVYAVGWLKRGPSGVIGSNKMCSAETAATIVSDFAAGRLVSLVGDRSGFAELVSSRAPERLDLGGWRRIDAHERSEGRRVGRPRIKLVDPREMLAVGLGRSAPRGRELPRSAPSMSD